MSPLWVLPLVVTAAGLAVLAVVVSRSAVVVAELRDACRSLVAVHRGADPLAAEVAAARASLEGLGRRVGDKGGSRPGRHYPPVHVQRRRR